ncbi:(2Fe-2S)-binding protein [uncultured Clostridium sp.]|jgi:NAD(P)H-nitrite reductase large subunit|uniref:(2Fe-2S)-binding protein n=1 Tax=uncultured Clostridium sp. TaxID=59620 RepID=UPI002631DD45|nr:(2Fe-2S)-binding protein [uncultured Clostridium sp.]
MEDNIICHCLNISEADIVNAINDGAKTLEEVQDVTGAGTACGSCINDIENIIVKNTK